MRQRLNTSAVFTVFILDVKSSRDGFNVLDNFNVSSIKTANTGNKVDALNVGRIKRLKLSASERRT